MYVWMYVYMYIYMCVYVFVQIKRVFLTMWNYYEKCLFDMDILSICVTSSNPLKRYLQIIKIKTST